MCILYGVLLDVLYRLFLLIKKPSYKVGVGPDMPRGRGHWVTSSPAGAGSRQRWPGSDRCSPG